VPSEDTPPTIISPDAYVMPVKLPAFCAASESTMGLAVSMPLKKAIQIMHPPSEAPANHDVKVQASV
jgi:hypothetical protein